MSGREVRLIVVVGLLLFFGYMPRSSLPSNKPEMGGVLILSAVLVPAMVVEAKVAREDGLPGSDVFYVPELQEGSHLVPHDGGHRGGGRAVENRRSSFWLSGKSSSSPKFEDELRRPYWLPVSFTPSVIFLAKGWLLRALASGLAPALLLPPGLQAYWEAVLLRLRFHLSLFWALLLKEVGWRSDDPKWFVPGGGRTVSVLWQLSGPDCNQNSCFRVLPAKIRDWFVIFLLLSPCLGFVTQLLFRTHPVFKKKKKNYT